MTFEEISDAVLSAQGVEAGLVQKIAHLDRIRGPRVPGGGGGYQFMNARRITYRVWIVTEKGFGECEDENVHIAINTAFQNAKLQPPNIQ